MIDWDKIPDKKFDWETYFEKTPSNMDKFEKAAIVGHYRNGVDSATIGAMYSIPEIYVRQIINEHLDKIEKL